MSAGAAPADGPVPTLGLAPRPAPDPLVVALVTAAAERVLRPAAPAGSAAAVRDHTAWRFSGRWWSAPVRPGRSRPWPGRVT